jgi:hypothetical protein
MTKWKAGRGLLGPLRPLLGRWETVDAKTPDGGDTTCTREFVAFGPGYVRLDAAWDMGARGVYREIAFFGKGDDDALAFWSFTVDGKRSSGTRCDAKDVHPDAIAFVASMPAGTARMVYWPADDGNGFHFVVESKAKAGWRRFLDHRYRPSAPPA